MENFEKCTVAMLGGPCSQHVTGNTSRQNQPQSAIIYHNTQQGLKSKWLHAYMYYSQFFNICWYATNSIIRLTWIFHVLNWFQKNHICIFYHFSALRLHNWNHYSGVIMDAMTSLITGVSIVCSTVCLDADQRIHQCSASLAFVRGIHRWPVNHWVPTSLNAPGTKSIWLFFMKQLERHKFKYESKFPHDKWVVNVKEVWISIKEWISIKIQNVSICSATQERVQYLPVLLSCVRFDRINPETLVLNVETVSCVMENPSCHQMIYRAMWWVYIYVV